MADQHHEHRHEAPPMSGRAKIAWLALAAIAAFYLWTEHRTHGHGGLKGRRHHEPHRT